MDWTGVAKIISDWSEIAKIFLSFALGLVGSLAIQLWVAADRRRRLSNAARDMLVTAAANNLRTIWMMDGAIRETLRHSQLMMKATFDIDPFLIRQMTTAEIVGVLSPAEANLMGQVLEDLATVQHSNESFYQAHENVVKNPQLAPIREHAGQYWNVYSQGAMSNLLNLLMASLHRRDRQPTERRSRALATATEPQRKFWRTANEGPDDGELLMAMMSSDLKKREPTALARAKAATCWIHDWEECPVPVVGVRDLLFPGDAAFDKKNSASDDAK